MMVVAPLLLVAVTEAIRANGEVFEGLYVSPTLYLIALFLPSFHPSFLHIDLVLLVI